MLRYYLPSLNRIVVAFVALYLVAVTVVIVGNQQVSRSTAVRHFLTSHFYSICSIGVHLISSGLCSRATIPYLYTATHYVNPDSRTFFADVEARRRTPYKNEAQTRSWSLRLIYRGTRNCLKHRLL